MKNQKGIEDTTISRSIAFNREVLKKVDAAKGFMSRSSWIMTACDEKLKREQRQGIS